MTEAPAAVLDLGPRLLAARAARFLTGTLERAKWFRRVRVASEGGELRLVIEVLAPVEECKPYLPTAVDRVPTVIVRVG